MMKPKAQTPHDEGLLEYLEDLIGTNRYVESIEKKGQEVETINEERGGTIHSLQSSIQSYALSNLITIIIWFSLSF